VRAGVTLFAEDAHVFATTVRENLKVVRGGLGEEEIRAALATGGLRDWVETLPRGIDTVLGTDGTTVSGWERRRLLLARAGVRRSGAAAGRAHRASRHRPRRRAAGLAAHPGRFLGGPRGQYRRRRHPPRRGDPGRDADPPPPGAPVSTPQPSTIPSVRAD